ncbi:hypothetical protein Tco_0046214 [Tanacetum coccineum]
MLQKCHGYGLTKGVIIQIFYHSLDEPTQGILDVTTGGIFLYKSPNQAFQILEDKILFKLDWSTKSQNEHHQKSVPFADGSDSNDDNYRLMEKLESLTIKMGSHFQSLKEEMHEMRKNYKNREDNHASKNNMNDDTLMCKRHKANSIQSRGYQNRNSHDSYSHQSYHDPNDFEKSDDQSKIDLEKSITKFLDGQRVASMYIKNNVNDMIIKMKPNEKNCQATFKNLERKINEWSKSRNVSSEQTDRTDPPPPKAHTEHVNAVFIGSGKSDEFPKTQKDPPPPIIVTNKIPKDKPIKASKKGYHVVKTKEYPFCEA